MFNGRNGVRASIALVGGILLALAPAGVAVATSSGTSVPPIIVAHPDNVMVNTNTTLTGIGFPKSSAVALIECGAKQWKTPNPTTRPCTGGSVSVETNSHGGFTTTFKVTLCPLGPTTTPPKPTSRTCYIGEPEQASTGTTHLVGAAKITVTYP